MTVWRICKRQYAPAAFSGDGGLHAAMRWNHKGHRIVYTAQSLSLAAVELWVNIPVAEPLASYVSIAAKIPGDLQITIFQPQGLPREWRDDPAPPPCETSAHNGLLQYQAGSSAHRLPGSRHFLRQTRI